MRKRSSPSRGHSPLFGRRKGRCFQLGFPIDRDVSQRKRVTRALSRGTRAQPEAAPLGAAALGSAVDGAGGNGKDRRAVPRVGLRSFRRKRRRLRRPWPGASRRRSPRLPHVVGPEHRVGPWEGRWPAFCPPGGPFERQAPCRGSVRRDGPSEGCTGRRVRETCGAEMRGWGGEDPARGVRPSFSTGLSASEDTTSLLRWTWPNEKIRKGQRFCGDGHRLTEGAAGPSSRTVSTPSAAGAR